MTLLLSTLKTYLTHAIGGLPATVLTDAATTARLWVNEAGQLLVNAHPWKFLERPPTTLDFTAAQEYVSLPSDFSKLLACAATSTTGRPFCLTDFQSIVQYRSAALQTIGGVFGAIVHPTQAAANAAPPVPRIELYPTPSANVTAALRISYRAGWMVLVNDSDAANIPAHLEPLLAAIVRAHARDLDEDTPGENLSRILDGGVMFRNAMQADASVQPEYGPLEGGAVLQADPLPMVQYDTVPDP